MTVALPSLRSGSSPARTWLALTALLVAAGLALRLAAAAGDLWLDEIWSFELLQRAASPWGVFWRINHDNNHHLNSLWMLLTGADAGSIVVRGLSVVLGGLGVVAAALVGARRSIAEAIFAATLFAVSYPMVHYTSEARGYAGVILFTLIAFYALEDYLTTGRRSALSLFALAAGFGLLFHLTMLVVYALLATWLFLVLFSRGRSLGQALTRSLLTLRLANRVVICILGFIVFAATQHGGMVTALSLDRPDVWGPVRDHGVLLRYVLGLPREVPAIAVSVAVMAAAAAAAAGARDLRTGFYALAAAAPPLPLLVAGIETMPRYFVVSAVALLLLIAQALAYAWQAGLAGRWVSVVLLALLLTAQGVQLARFFDAGRGDYSLAVTHMMTAAGRPVIAAGDQDFQNGTMVAFHAERLGVPVTYVPNERFCDSRPFWYLRREHLERSEVRLNAVDAGPSACRGHFVLERVFPAWGLSGWTWLLYRRVS
jgi:hypothetical protein